MSAKSAIEWTDATWNPVVGCDPISPGCEHCYAQTLHNRRHQAWLAGNWPKAPEQYHLPFERVQLKPERLDDPSTWRAPRRIFVNSVSDLFHDDVPFSFIDQVMCQAWFNERHTFQILTKRPRRMLEWRQQTTLLCLREPAAFLPNVWFGVSVELDRFVWRAKLLAEMPAAVRFISAEPLLGPLPSLKLTARTEIPLPEWPVEALESGAAQCFKVTRPISWVITGGESGAGARPAHPDWYRDLRDRCEAAGVAYFHKQNGEWNLTGRTPDSWLLHPSGTFMPRSEGTQDYPYGLSSGKDQDLVDRGHPGWVRVKRVGTKAAGRMLDGRTWDEFPKSAEVS